MNKHNQFVTIWMFIGMLFGLAIGNIIGKSQGNVGITMCFGLVFGMISGICAETFIKKLKDKTKKDNYFLAYKNFKIQFI